MGGKQVFPILILCALLRKKVLIYMLIMELFDLSVALRFLQLPYRVTIFCATQHDDLKCLITLPYREVIVRKTLGTRGETKKISSMLMILLIKNVLMEMLR